jgi:1-aminocyclopropane-1-carboxylate deaminase/D-cysteine desulfhydrase-like pyridoxal-dependent ACC family enzyme
VSYFSKTCPPLPQLLEEAPRLGSIDHIVFACGSGGTAAGVALGARLARMPHRIHAVGVCDSPGEFYDQVRTQAHASTLPPQVDLPTHPSSPARSPSPHPQVDELAAELGADARALGGARSWLSIYQGRGAGYAKSTNDELEMAARVSAASGVLLDPVYSGKALYHFCAAVRAAPDAFRDSQVLFWHTGGQLSMFEKVQQLEAVLPKGQIQRLSVPVPGAEA